MKTNTHVNIFQEVSLESFGATIFQNVSIKAFHQATE